MEIHSDAARVKPKRLGTDIVSAFPVSTIVDVEEQVAADFRAIWVSAFGW